MPGDRAGDVPTEGRGGQLVPPAPSHMSTLTEKLDTAESLLREEAQRIQAGREPDGAFLYGNQVFPDTLQSLVLVSDEQALNRRELIQGNVPSKLACVPEASVSAPSNRSHEI